MSHQTPTPKGPGRIEQSLRTALSGAARRDVQAAVGWDNSQVSRFLNGETGITIERIDTLVDAIGFVLVSTRYLDAVATLGEVGMHCSCARQGGGECGPKRC